MEITSNMTAMMVAVPLLAVMAAGFFRLDEFFGKPRRRAARKYRRIPLAGGIDERGMPIGIDPDGRPLRETR